MSKILYRLAPGVSVRNESFGLLFYSADDTNLTFVKSGDLVDAQQLSDWHNEAELCKFSEIEKCNVRKIISTLLERGLVLEKRISL